MICLSCFFYYGCAAMLVPYTSDPQKKMEWSIYLSNVNRPIPARRLLLEAIQIIEEDDKALMANYYLARGIMLSSSRYHAYRKGSGAKTWNSEVDGRLFEAGENYRLASELFIEMELYYEASIAEFLLSEYYQYYNRKKQQCRSLKNSLKYHLAGIDNGPQNGIYFTLKDKNLTVVEYISNIQEESYCN